MENEKIYHDEPGTPLNAFLARGGLCSRRAAIEIIKSGQVYVNGEVVTEPGYRVQQHDKVKYQDKIYRPEKHVYVLLNKPKGYVTTTADEMERKTVLDLIKGKGLGKERLYPVGRLDRDTTGLLLITNDGYLSQKLAHPKNNVTKKYYVALDKPLHIDDTNKLKKGIYLEDGKSWFDKILLTGDKGGKNLIVEIHGGKNRIIKRMFKHLGYKVVLLDRIEFAGLTKQKLEKGKWRFLTDAEVEDLKNLKKTPRKAPVKSENKLIKD